MPSITKTPNTASEHAERNSKKLGPTSKIGNLTRDPELRFSQDGKPYARCGLAVETPKIPGEWAGERVTTFYELVAFGSLAENWATCLTKGVRVVVTGNAELDSWTGDDGEVRTTKKIVLDAIGPDLRWSTAAVTSAGKATRPTAGAPPVVDDDEEPF